jgi:hypothetical protein
LKQAARDFSAVLQFKTARAQRLKTNSGMTPLPCWLSCGERSPQLDTLKIHYVIEGAAGLESSEEAFHVSESFYMLVLFETNTNPKWL